MNVVPKNGSDIVPLPTGQPSGAASARERAIAKLMSTPDQPQTPVPTPTGPVKRQDTPAQEPVEAAQADSGDSASVETPAATPAPKEDPLSPRFAQLARQERALRAKVQAQEAAIKAKEDAFAAREAALKAKESEYQSDYIPKSRFKQDPLTVLTEQGLTYDDLTQAILGTQTQQDPRILAEIDRLKAEIKETKDYQAKAKEEYAQNQKQAYNQAVNQIRNDAKQLVATDPSFETIRETKSVNDVVDLITKTFNEDGILLTVEEAANEVETYLVDNAIKLAQIKKIQARMAEAAKKADTAAPTQSQPAQKQSQPQMKTLTNAVNASKSLSARERAIAAFKGELK